MSRAPPSSLKAAAAKAALPGASFAALYEAHADQVFVWALRYARGRRSWAQDVTHDVFVKAWEQRAWLREEDARSWLFRVTQNVAFSTLRRERTVSGGVRHLLAVFGERHRPSAPDELAERREGVESALAVLGRLPGQERVVMGLKLLDDLNQREIAQMLSLSEGYVSKLIGRAQARLLEWGWKVDDARAT